MKLHEIIKSMLTTKAKTVLPSKLPERHYHAATQAKRAYRTLKRKIGPRQARRLTRKSYSLINPAQPET